MADNTASSNDGPPNKAIVETITTTGGRKSQPMPTNDPEDPLNWPSWLKVAVLVQTSLLAAIGGLNTATINPALVQLAKEFGISTVRASYQTTVCIALNGIAPWLWIPLAHRFGRRPIYLVTTLLGFASILGAAYAQSYAQLLVARVFNGLFPVGFALGATTVTDVFRYEQRGRATGVFTVTVVNGSHLAPIFGGLLGQYCGWRWIFKFLAIVDAVLLVVAFFCLPETLYIRPRPGEDEAEPDCRSSEAKNAVVGFPASKDDISRRSKYMHRMRLITNNTSYSLNPLNFIGTTLRLFLSPSAVFPAIYYASLYGFASIVPAVTVAAIFTKFFHWNTLHIGLSYGAALTIGGSVGELAAGWVCDRVAKSSIEKAAKSHRMPLPEVRLRPIWPGAFICPAGLLIYGFTLQYHVAPPVPLFGMGLACFGLQIVTTTTLTYAIDCHREQSAEVAQLFNFIRQCFGMTFAFYVVDLGDRIGYQWTFLFFAGCGGILAFMPVVALMAFGSRLRRSGVADTRG